MTAQTHAHYSFLLSAPFLAQNCKTRQPNAEPAKSLNATASPFNTTKLISNNQRLFSTQLLPLSPRLIHITTPLVINTLYRLYFLFFTILSPQSFRRSIPFAGFLRRPQQSQIHATTVPSILTLLSAHLFYSTRLVIINLSCTNFRDRV